MQPQNKLNENLNAAEGRTAEAEASVLLHGDITYMSLREIVLPYARRKRKEDLISFIRKLKNKPAYPVLIFENETRVLDELLRVAQKLDDEVKGTAQERLLEILQSMDGPKVPPRIERDHLIKLVFATFLETITRMRDREQPVIIHHAVKSEPVAHVERPMPFLERGDRPCVHIKEWIENFTHYLRVSNIIDAPEDRKTSILLCCVGTAARNLVRSMPGEKNSPEQVFDLLERLFCSPKTVLTKWDDLLGRRQKPGENTAQYMAALNQLAGECGIEPQANTLIQTLFIRCLLNPERKRILLTREFSQNDLLLQEANKLSTNDRPIQAE